MEEEEEEEEEVLLTAYDKRQKVGKHNALSGKTTLVARGPVCGSEHYTSTLRLALRLLAQGGSDTGSVRPNHLATL